MRWLDQVVRAVGMILGGFLAYNGHEVFVMSVAKDSPDGEWLGAALATLGCGLILGCVFFWGNRSAIIQHRR